MIHLLRGFVLALSMLAGACLLTPCAHAEEARNVRSPLGVLAHISVEDALNRYKGPDTRAARRAYLKGLYVSLLANPAISGLALGQHWDHIEVDDPVCILKSSCAGSPEGFDWTYLDDAFAVANAAHKSIQLIINPGVVSPTWLMSKIPSCDALFERGDTAPWDCGKVTFNNFPEQSHADAPDPPLPLPWNPVYILAWDDFLAHLSARYSGNPAFTSIAMGGPVCGSTEIIFPTTQNKSVQVSGMPADEAWQVLIRHSFPFLPGYQHTDQVFIDAWKQTIDAYEFLFSGITLVITPDDGADLPEQPYPVSVHPGNFLYAADCAISNFPMSCEAKTEILSYFARARGPNEKFTQVGGMVAGSNVMLGNIGVPGVKLLAALAPPLPGGAEFDLQVSFPASLQKQGCPDYSQKDPAPADCVYLTPEQAAFNTFKVFFNGTPAAAFFDGTPGSASMRYVAVDYPDVQYAQDPKNKCQTFLPGNTKGPPSLQDLYNLAAYELDVMAGKVATLPPSTCAH